MEVLNLATKEKQDEILSNFPISGGTDFFVGTGVDISTGATISGKGLLLWIAINDTTTTHRWIEVDGVRFVTPNNTAVSIITPFFSTVTLGGAVSGYALLF